MRRARPGSGRASCLGCVVLFGAVLGSLAGVMRGVVMMPLRHLGMMRGLFVVAGLVVPGSFAMMVGRVLMVLGGLGVVMGSFLRHSCFPFACKIPCKSIRNLVSIFGSRHCTAIANR